MKFVRMFFVLLYFVPLYAQVTNVQVPGYRGEGVQVLVTKEKNLRLVSIPAVTRVDGVLNSSEISSERDIKFLCEHKTNNNPSFGFDFSLKGKAFVWSQAAQQQVLNQLGAGKIENQILRGGYRLQIFFEADAKSKVATSLKPEAVINKLNRDLQRQSPQIAKTGDFQVSLDGLESLICDLVSKKAQISILARFDFEDAIPSRYPRISPGQLEQLRENVYVELINTPSSFNSNPLVFAALLSDRYHNVFGKSVLQYGADWFLKLMDTIYNPATKQMRQFSSADYQRAAENLDLVKYENATAITESILEMKWEYR